MSSLSRRNPGQEFVQPPVSAYIAAYGLWFFTFLVGLLVAFVVRDLYQMAMVFTTLDRYAVHLFNQFGVVALVIALTVLVVATEAYYRHGVPRRAVFARFARVLGILALILAVAQTLRLALEVVAGAVNLISVLILVIVLIVYVWTRTVVQRRAVSSPSSAARQAIMTRVVRAATLVGGAVLIVLPIKFPINLYDEGLALVNGMRILSRLLGDLPARPILHAGGALCGCRRDGAGRTHLRHTGAHRAGAGDLRAGGAAAAFVAMGVGAVCGDGGAAGGGYVLRLRSLSGGWTANVPTPSARRWHRWPARVC